MRKSNLRQLLASGVAAGALSLASGVHAQAEQTVFVFDQPAMPMAAALQTVGRETGVNILVDSRLVKDIQSRELKGQLSADAALVALLDGTGLTVRKTAANSVMIVSAQDPQGGSAAGGGASTVEALIVTAQKKEEDIQDVPIAISAFSQEDLTRSQIAGGPDLMTQIPNMTFTKTNFASYSIQIRGIGTQAISATTDAAVAVAFNNTSFIRNRFFEQEFYDLQRVEVLRGPQGTLYGRNATAGVVNVISAKPKFHYEARVSADIANYNSSRLEGMVNIPLVEDAVALRLAGAWTKRDGYVTNEIAGEQTDGRDIWSTRASLRFSPSQDLDVNIIWEHFEEDDDRLRSGKQVCKRDDRTEIGGIPHRRGTDGYSDPFSQSCIAASLYSPDSFQAPDGFSLPFYHPLGQIGLPTKPIGFDPYASTVQSRDLRVIESTVEPIYRAQSDIGQVQINLALGENLTLTSETAYSVDELFSVQDYNRFNTRPGAFGVPAPSEDRPGVLNNGVFCDPQIGCTDRLVGMDLSSAETTQFSQELRVSSDYDGSFNFSLGGNFVRYDTEDKYYVFINTLTLYAALSPSGSWGSPKPPYIPGVTDNTECMPHLPRAPDPNSFGSVVQCVPIDPNPVTSLNDQGHNYFLSKNPYKLISGAVFGEVYYNLTDDLKLTGGLRWTIDKKEAPRVPSWLLAGNTLGHPVAEVVRQEWREPTGRLAIDWKPELGFTDETLLYASFARGYKAGGANPPPAGVVTRTNNDIAEELVKDSIAHPRTFDPEFVSAFEIGSKNTLMDGRVTLNMGAFYYDYTGYQISYITNRSAINLNFDAEVWGLEVEADWRPLENLRLGFKGGYQGTRVADGERAIDMIDRTAGREDWVVVRPFPAFPSNCIVPLYTVVNNNADRLTLAPNVFTSGNPGPCEFAYALGQDPVTQRPYVPNPTLVGPGAGSPISAVWAGYAGFNPLDESLGHNNGEGFFKDLSGNELPNAPNFTSTITADYTVPLTGDWMMTLHTDLYYQSEAWTRIFNMEGYDKLKAYSNINLAAIITNEPQGWKVMAYVKNVMDRDSITGAFLNSDDSGLTTNVFLTEPRLYGIRVTKTWDGGPLLGSLGRRRDAGEPYRFTLELGGQVQRRDAVNDGAAPALLEEFPAGLERPRSPGSDLDWGNGGHAKLIYSADGGWKLAGSARFGKTNGSLKVFDSQAGDAGCTALSQFKYTPTYCAGMPDGVNVRSTNWSQFEETQREDHAVVDFAIGRDVGFGVLGGDGRSTAWLGLQYANLASERSLTLTGIPNWDIPSGGWDVISATADRYKMTARAAHDFEGVGPTVSWEAAALLFESEAVGRVDLDWSIGAGVLFGKQDVSIDGEERRYALSGVYNTNSNTIVETEIVPIAISRSESRTVPTVAASIGLSYSIGGASIGAGYRWERYFDAIDGGYDKRKEFDRTIDGPYFKLSVGFGD